MKQNNDNSPKGKLPALYTLKEAVAAFGTSGITVRSLRREVNAGRIRCVRSRPGRNAKIVITESELLRWLDEDAAARQFVSKHETTKTRDSGMDPNCYAALVAKQKAVRHG